MPTRRGFLARTGAAAIGLTLASKLPGIASAPPRLAKPGDGTSIAVTPPNGPIYAGMVLKIDDEFVMVKRFDSGTNIITVERGHA